MSIKTTIEASIFIARPAEAVTRVLLDPDQAVRWTTALERFEVVSGAACQSGAVARLHDVQNRRPDALQDGLLEADPGHRYKSRVSGEALGRGGRDDPPSRGRRHAPPDLLGRLGPPLPPHDLAPLDAKSVLRQAEAELGKLRAVVEAS